MNSAAPKGNFLYSSLRSLYHATGLESFGDKLIARLSGENKRHRESQELLYQSIVLDFLTRHQIDDDFFPLGGAANYSLLYLLCRCCTENPFDSILELGAGQSTILLDRLMKDSSATISTLEHNEFWKGEIEKHVAHGIHHAPLEEKLVHGVKTTGYDLQCLGQEQFNLVIVDGPNGTSRYSRAAALQIAEKHLKSEFVLIFDDAERPGEQETIDSCLKLFRDKNIKVHTQKVDGTASQFIIATEAFLRVSYY